ncbi:type II toxin-antitoxin system death-on-curing family toxin [Oceanibaculum indicum]|uniref:Death-on-curing protein n=1 Tax=Oceanibaculum indicum P24 TaxID=1207063 RepID=K2KCM0_9PROT|nr:Fic family protein [Oceanibaculum indicum]EKE75040.1 death-on-curing protein [Oceanibaculum indicum P24]
MIEPLWLTVPDVLYLHERSIELFGGSYGTREEGLLESAVMRPQQLWSYTEPPPSLSDLAASIGFGLARNHPLSMETREPLMRLFSRFCMKTAPILM